MEQYIAANEWANKISAIIGTSPGTYSTPSSWWRAQHSGARGELACPDCSASATSTALKSTTSVSTSVLGKGHLASCQTGQVIFLDRPHSSLQALASVMAHARLRVIRHSLTCLFHKLLEESTSRRVNDSTSAFIYESSC